tara:strand:- start:364 stop:594 length:231 start_codon:yes stop_codon:yes gene_type:complete
MSIRTAKDNKNMQNEPQTMTVMDYEVGLVYQYKIESVAEVDSELAEEIMIEQGHDIEQCYYMIHTNPYLQTIKITV